MRDIAAITNRSNPNIRRPNLPWTGESRGCGGDFVALGRRGLSATVQSTSSRQRTPRDPEPLTSAPETTRQRAPSCRGRAHRWHRRQVAWKQTGGRRWRESRGGSRLTTTCDSTNRCSHPGHLEILHNANHATLKLSRLTNDTTLMGPVPINNF